MVNMIGYALQMPQKQKEIITCRYWNKLLQKVQQAGASEQAVHL